MATQDDTSRQKTFFQIGSPFNILDRARDGDYRSQEDSYHYSNNQISFAHLADATLIEIIKQCRSGCKIEEIYQKITAGRLRIFCETRSTDYEKFLTTDVVLLLPDIEFGEDSQISEIIRSVNALSYRDSENLYPTATIFREGEDDRFVRYREKGVSLKLSSVVKLLSLECEEIDNDIILGDLEKNDEKSSKHNMGIYRHLFLADGVDEEQEKAEREKRIARIKRVDEVMELAFRKSMEAESEAEILQNAFIFAALRGYNVRSVSGACFAQEMSLRLVLAMKGLPQFCKMPGVYLDIEAVSSRLLAGKGDEHFAAFIEKQIWDYQKSLDPDAEIEPDSFFDHPQNMPNPEKEFLRYLIENKKYRREDLEEILLYEDDGQMAFTIAASLGDENFFDMINQEENLNLERFSKEDWESVWKCAKKYGSEKICNAASQYAGIEFSEFDDIDLDFEGIDLETENLDFEISPRSSPALSEDNTQPKKLVHSTFKLPII